MTTGESIELKYNAHITAGQLYRNIKYAGLSEKPFTLKSIPKGNMISVVLQ